MYEVIKFSSHHADSLVFHIQFIYDGYLSHWARFNDIDANS